jgi:hypothetical protein
MAYLLTLFNVLRYTCGLFYYAVRIWSVGRIILNDEWKRIWKEAVVL